MTPLRGSALLWLFVISLLLFLPLRWDAEPWLRHQLLQLQPSLPVTLEVARLQTSGLGIRAEDIELAFASGKAPLHLAAVQLAVDWLSSLQGHPSVRVQWQGESVEGSVTLGLKDTYVELSALDAQLDVRWLQQQLDIPLPLQLQGELGLGGEMRLLRDADNALIPLSAHLQLNWQHAAATVADQQHALGDYALHLQGSENNDWSWQVDGGKMLQLQGKGGLKPAAKSRWQWPLSGEVTVTAQSGSPLASLLGAAQHIRLSGTLVRPALNPIRGGNHE